jgi:trans-aconitate methyltransferase
MVRAHDLAIGRASTMRAIAMKDGATSLETAPARSVPQRFIWAIKSLDVAPADRLLEIGCGRGVAVSLICDRLMHGTITAIDRSPAAIAAAKERNRDHIASGKAVFHTSDLARADFTGARFNKAFAVNVNLFWIEAARELAVVRNALIPRGTLTLVYEPPSAKQVRTIAGKLTSMLQVNGFSVDDVLSKRGASPLLGVTARVARGRRG